MNVEFLIAFSIGVVVTWVAKDFWAREGWTMRAMWKEIGKRQRREKAAKYAEKDNRGRES